MAGKNKPKLVVALDVDTLAAAKKIANALYPRVRWFKVGSQLFTACGPEIIRFLKAKGAKVFLDLKFHDIPNTAANAARQAARLRADMFNAHISGGEEMLKAAVEAARQEAKARRSAAPIILGVTVLTSQKTTLNSVLALSGLAKRSGLDGVVASVNEAGAIKRRLGRDFVVLCPGIRLEGAPSDDQKRRATPEEAKKQGADFIVVGRPVIKAKDPRKEAGLIIDALNK
ncbi:MAG: orotidine-5'-phosphate decarboxylase [Candidatus Omnitrophica bacterium]|nr:orotidine-5'-phosphate decarboxylase [Candidatus Omnitrophota bacterium]